MVVPLFVDILGEPTPKELRQALHGERREAEVKPKRRK
jgi:hypothetical protein